MYQSAGMVTLRNGEQVELGIVRAPDAEWRERIVRLLAHKGDIWVWQNDSLLRAGEGVETNTYLLHRGGQPFASAMTILYAGVGFVAHVWTIPEDRGKGAASLLMDAVMDDFAARNGQALFLDTGDDTGIHSTAYRIYERLGFRPIEPISGYMEYYGATKAEFERAYFASGQAQIEPLDWRHLPASSALFAGDFPGLLRCLSARLVGRQITETLLLQTLHDDLERQASEKHARVLFNDATGAVVGLATWDWHPFWAQTCVVDVFCHPHYQQQVDDLLAALSLPGTRLVAYADERDSEKARLLGAHGFQQTAVLSKRVAASAAKSEFLDVFVFEK